MRKFAGLALVVVASACAPKLVPAPVVSAPKFPEFVMPEVPPALAASPAAASQDRGWRFFQTGDLKNAEREFGAALKAMPAFYPAEAALGDLELARKDNAAALSRFDRALAGQRRYLPALLGRGQALVGLNREADALAAFEAALETDPSMADVRGRVEVLKFRRQQEDLGLARRAARAGRLDEAAAAYAGAIAASPGSPFLYRELAFVERQQGDLERAFDHFRQAAALDPTDAISLVQTGELLETRGDFDGAAKAYAEALAIEPGEAVEAKLENVRARAELSRLPEEYRAIDRAPQITRADLAALIGVRLAPLLKSRRRDAVLITDVRSNWAAPWIMTVAGAGVMDPFVNHAFQPRTFVRRIDLALAVSRLLARLAAANPSQAKAWQSGRAKFSDLSPGHLNYLAVAAAVASGVMTVGPDNAFQPSKPVSGAEALDAIARVQALAGLTSGPRGKGAR